MVYEAPPLNDPSLLIDKAFINGEFVSSITNHLFQVHDPATGTFIANCPDMTVSEGATAIDAAAAAFSSFRKTTPRQRSNLLRRWYEHVVTNADDIATLITWESGKALVDARAEVSYAASFIKWFAEEAPRVYGDTIPASAPGKRITTFRQPVGVCGLITPWNFPAAMVTRKVAPALAAGCTVVLKSPGETPLTANALAELARRSGFPPGVFNVVTALRNTVNIGKLLSTDERVKKLSFTGSTNVGKILVGQCAGTLKKLSMELGGNSPFIVFDDCPDLDEAVAGALASKFRGAGQTCVCANRIFVQDGVHDEFIRRFADKVNELKVGYGFNEGVTQRPLIHRAALEKVESHVRDAIDKGARLVTGGKRLPEPGDNFFAPTVLTEMTSDMKSFREEIFGPVAAVFRFSSEDEVIKLANDAQVGLAGYLFSRDIDRIYRVAEAMEVGMVGVNTGMISDAAAPFGGIKESGFGKEGSKYGIEDYTVLKSLTISTRL